MRHALEIVSEIATRDPYAVAMALGNSLNLHNIFPLKLFLIAHSFVI